LYLGSAGVGRITVVDPDRVDTTNLQRQIAHTLARVGSFKADSIATAIGQINPDVLVTAVTAKAEGQALHAWVQAADVVLDCTDNFQTRHAINKACVHHQKPLVSGAALRMDGQVSVFDSRQPLAPCYACLFPEEEAPEETQCATMGVFAPLVGIVGSMQAAEALKLLCGTGESLAGRLLMLDALHMRWSEIGTRRAPGCKVCGTRPAAH
jgi:molybdopterin/thiamine biosynthesis adenylyltransferase